MTIESPFPLPLKTYHVLYPNPNHTINKMNTVSNFGKELKGNPTKVMNVIYPLIERLNKYISSILNFNSIM